jgi:hypothetical protein
VIGTVFPGSPNQSKTNIAIGSKRLSLSARATLTISLMVQIIGHSNFLPAGSEIGLNFITLPVPNSAIPDAPWHIGHFDL